MTSTYKALTIKRQSDGLFAVVDADESPLVISDRLFDAAIILRFLMGKSMSRAECDFASALLKDFDEKQFARE